jgi:hypothetical protein
LVLTLGLPSEAPGRLQARVLSADGKSIWSAAALNARRAPDGPVVVLEVPPGVLAQGDYQVILAADTAAAPELADYAFTVLRR